ncbi:MAG TPA: hypothetical protein VNJ08_12145 [Bacteriovoracaceae bacterium]|nr:hypothetical protein [Bacteriovoracaceae bacterium]
MTKNNEILLSDTNIILKLLLFTDIDLTQISYPSYGKIKFHPIVQEEIGRWKRAYAVKGKHLKVAKFGLSLIENALKISRYQTLEVSSPTNVQKTSKFADYEKILTTIKTSSAAPTENDWMLLYHSELYECFMVTHDDGGISGWFKSNWRKVY